MENSKQFRPSFSPTIPNRILNDDTVALSLQRLKDGRESIFTVGEIAMITGCSERVVYKILDVNDKRDISIKEFLLLSREACKRGDFSLVELALPDLFVITPLDDSCLNGSIDDEIAESVEYFGSARAAFTKGKYDIGEKWLAGAEKEVQRMRAEFKLKKGGR